MLKVGDKVKNRYFEAAGTIVEIKQARGRTLCKIEMFDEVSGEKLFNWYDEPDLEKTE